MIKWRAGPPEYFQSFLEYCYKSLDVWGVEYCIILHEEKRLEGWRRWNLLFLLCARELHMMVRVWWCSDLELGETINVFDLILAWNVTSNYYTCLDVGEKKAWLFRTLLFSHSSRVCVLFLHQIKHYFLQLPQPCHMFQLSWPVHVQRVSEYFYYLLFLR